MCHVLCPFVLKLIKNKSPLNINKCFTSFVVKIQINHIAFYTYFSSPFTNIPSYLARRKNLQIIYLFCNDSVIVNIILTSLD